jgi:hypothetical protein
LIVDAATAELLSDVLPAARALSNANGIATMDQLMRRLQLDGVDQTLIRVLLEADRNFHWLGTNAFWSVHAPGRNRVVNISQRILAVNDRQRLEDMQEGIEREFNFRISTGAGRLADLCTPSTDQLRQFYASYPAFILEGDWVSSIAPIPLSLLGEEKQALVNLLRAAPDHVMDRPSLMAACDELGLNRATVGVWTSYAECLKRFGPNVWGLRGAHVSEAVVERVQKEARSTSRSYDRTKLDGRTASGGVWMARRLTPTLIYSGVLPFDWANDVLAGRAFEAIEMVSGESLGTLKFDTNFNWGYTSIFAKERPKPGDVLRLTVDLRDGLAYLELGGDELLSPPFDL